MGLKSYLAALSLFITTGQVSATFTLSYEFKLALNSAANNVPTGTLWALVVDGGDNVFAGFGLDDSLYNQTAGTADTYFTSGVTNISLGAVIAGGTVFGVGGFTDSGTAGGVLSGLTLGQNGLATGQEFAFFWFPGVTYTGPGSYLVANEVGGMQSTDDEGFLTSGMVIPSDTQSVDVGAFSVSSGDGNTPNNNFRAVTLVPEPGTALLAALGSLIMLRRRREVVA